MAIPPMYVSHGSKRFVHAFGLSGGVHVYSNPDNNTIVTDAIDDANGALLCLDDIFYHVGENRAATENEMNAAILDLPIAKIPDFEGSAALVRVLSGIKPKRVSRSKVLAKEPEVENDYDEVDDDEESDDSDDDEEDEEELEDDEE